MVNICHFEIEVSSDSDSSGVMCTHGYSHSISSSFVGVALNPLLRLEIEMMRQLCVSLTSH